MRLLDSEMLELKDFSSPSSRLDYAGPEEFCETVLSFIYDF